jgi:predicted nucleic acid-binding protein
MENEININLEALNVLSFYSHALKNYGEEKVHDSLSEKDNIVYALAKEYIGNVCSADEACESISPESFESARKAGIIKKVNGIYVTPFASSLLHSVENLDLLFLHGMF